MLWITIILHYFADMATSIFQPLGPYLTEKFSVSPRTFAMALYSVSLTTSIFQPLFGMITDRVERRNLYLAIVVSLTVLSAYMISLAGSFLMVLILALVAQLANSAFHPMGASIAGQRGKGHHIALFSLAGMFGYATGPIFITWYAQEYDLRGLHLLGISLAVLAIITIPRVRALKAEWKERPKLSKEVFTRLVFLMFFVSFRSFAMGLAQIYGPLYVRSMGGSLVLGGSLLTFARFSGMVLSFVGVIMREKISNAAVNITTALVMASFGLAFTFTRSQGAVVTTFVAMLAGAYLSMSSNVVEAQSRTPKNPGFASSVIMGLAWSLGSLMNLIYSSLFGNDVRFMVNSFWIVSVMAGIFAILDSAYIRKRP